MTRQSLTQSAQLALASWCSFVFICAMGGFVSGCAKDSRKNVVAPPSTLTVTISASDSIDSEGTLAVSAAISGQTAGSTVDVQWNQANGANGSFSDDKSASTDWVAPVAASADEAVVLKVTVTEKDSNGIIIATKSATHDVTVRAPPTLTITSADASTASLQGGGSFTLDGTVTGGKAPYTFRFNQTSGNPSVVTIVTPTGTQGTTTFSSQVNTTLVTVTEDTQFVLTIIDAYGVQVSSSAIQVELTPPPPIDVVVSLTPISVQGGSTITASGVVTGGLGGSYTYQWNQLSGPLVNFSDPNALTTSVATPVVSVDSPIVLQLTATDASGFGTDTETATLSVTPVPLVITSVTATPSDLPSSGSTTLVAVISGGTGPVSLTWDQTVGTGIVFANANLSATTATMPTVSGATANLTVRITATDSLGSVSGTVALTVNPPLTLSSLSSTPSSVQDGQSSSLSAVLTGGTGAKTHSWVQTAGQVAIIANPTSQSTMVTVAAGTPPQTLVFRYQSSDSVGGSVMSTVNLIVTASPAALSIDTITATPNDVPSAGNSSLTATTSGGTGSITFLWQLISGTGAVISTPTSLTTGVTFPAVTGSIQTFTFQLTATDSVGPVTRTVNVTVNPLQAITSVTASPASVQAGQSSTLNQSSSGGTGTINHSWTQLAGTAATIVTPTAASTVVNVLAGTLPQTLTFQYARTDSTGTVSMVVNLVVTAAPPSGAPVLSLWSVAGVDSQTIAVGQTATVTVNYTLAGGGPGTGNLNYSSGEAVVIIQVAQSTVGAVYSATYTVTPVADPVTVSDLTRPPTVLSPVCTDTGNGQTSVQTLRTVNVHRQSPVANIPGIQLKTVQSGHPARTFNLGPGMIYFATTTIVNAQEIDQEVILAVPDKWVTIINFGITAGQVPFLFLNPKDSPGSIPANDFLGRPRDSEITVGVPAGWRVFKWTVRMRTDIGQYLFYFARDGSTATVVTAGRISSGDPNIVYFTAGMEFNASYDVDSLTAGDTVDGHFGLPVNFVGQTPVLGATASPPTVTQDTSP